MATDFVPQLVNTMSTLDTAQINIPALKDTRLVDTPMIVTLDQLQAYDHDPRLRRNPRYDDIKASIRHRGLDTPPSITRRPGESCFRIRNGGNTRLSILRELWLETRENQFFEFPCMFRPWPERAADPEQYRTDGLSEGGAGPARAADLGSPGRRAGL